MENSFPRRDPNAFETSSVCLTLSAKYLAARKLVNYCQVKDGALRETPCRLIVLPFQLAHSSKRNLVLRCGFPCDPNCDASGSMLAPLSPFVFPGHCGWHFCPPENTEIVKIFMDRP